MRWSMSRPAKLVQLFWKKTPETPETRNTFGRLLLLFVVCACVCVCGRRPSAWYRTQQIYAARWMITHGQADVSNQKISVRLMQTTNVWLMQVWHCELATSVTFRRLVKVSLVHLHFVNNTLYYFTGYCCISLCCLSYDVQTNCLWNVCSCTTYRPESTDIPAVVKVVCSKRRGALSGKRSPRPEGMGFLGRRATSPLPNSKGRVCPPFLSTTHYSPVIVLLSRGTTVFGHVGLKSQQGRPKPKQMGRSPPSYPSL